MEDETAEDLAGWLVGEHKRLAKTQFGFRRYVTKDVDAFLGDVAARLGRAELPEPSWVRAAQFRTITGLGSGYGLRAVDELLDELQVRMLVIRGGPDLEPGMAAMIARVERARFKCTWSGGYDLREVDTFLDQVIETLLRGHRPGAVPAFTIRRRGYNKQDVDAFGEELRGYRENDL